jgi:hypothetical protein
VLSPHQDLFAPREKYIPSQIAIERESNEKQFAFFQVSSTDLIIVDPHTVQLRVRQFVRDSNPI